jgi:hypothetical protein
MLVTPDEAAALIAARDPRTVRRNAPLRRYGTLIRIETADLAEDAASEARMNAEVVGMRTGTTVYSGKQGARQFAADQSALRDARARARSQR